MSETQRNRMKVLYMESRISGYTPEGYPLYDRPVGAADQRIINKSIIGNGVHPNPSDNLQVSQGDGMTVQVNEGIAAIEGAFGIAAEKRVLIIQASDPDYDRIDRVVLRLDLNANNRIMDLYVIQGVPSSTPKAPELTRTTSIYEIGLANLFVGAGTSTIPEYKITDTRLDKDTCGLIHAVVEQVDTTEIFNQYMALLDEIKLGWAENRAYMEQLQEQWAQTWEDWWAAQEDKGAYVTTDAEYQSLTTEDKQILKAVNEVNTKATSTSIPLAIPVDAWAQDGDIYRATVAHEGIVKSGYDHIVGPDLTEKEAKQEYEDCGVQADERKHEIDGEMVFVADDKPSMDLYVNVLQMKVEVM